MIFKNYTKIEKLDEEEHFYYCNLYNKETIEDEEFLNILLQIDKIKKLKINFLKIRDDLQLLVKKLQILKKIKEVFQKYFYFINKPIN